MASGVAVARLHRITPESWGPLRTEHASLRSNTVAVAVRDVLSWLELESSACGGRELAYLDTTPPRLAMSPQSVSRAQHVAILSSRVTRNFERRHDWFDAVALAVRESTQRDCEIITTAGTTCDRFLAPLSGAPAPAVVNVVIAPSSQAVAHWVVAQRKLRTSTASDRQVHVSPPLTSRLADGAESVVCRDELLWQIAEHVYVVHVVPGGTVERVVSQGIGRPRCPERVRVAVRGDQRDAERLATWAARGAVRWYPPPGRHGATLQVGPPRRPILHLSGLSDERRYLSHWTRRTIGPWPDQRPSEFAHEMLFRPETRDRSATATLARIVRSRRLFASRRLTRGSHPVVSFTERKLSSFRQLATFRPHLARWDFTNYGVRIARDWLTQRGARPVIYGDASDWATLPDEDRPYFQLRSSENEAGRRFQWDMEAEWRVDGDVDLSQLGEDDAQLFVPDCETAWQLAPISPWSIVVMDADGGPD